VADPEVQRRVAELKAKYAGKKIIAGIDMCQRLSGGSLKLAAFDKLLCDYSNAMGSVVLVQKSLRPGSNSIEEATTSDDLTKMVHDINARYSRAGGEGVLVDYEEVTSHRMMLKDRVVLYLAADVFLLTCIREGLNLNPLEYIYTRKDLEHAGVVVASEFSTCSSILSGSLKINPFYALQVADTLDKALCMTSRECFNRRMRDITFVSTHPSSSWTKQILSDLNFMHKQRRELKAGNGAGKGLLGVAAEAARMPKAANVETISACYALAR
jgi:trehalose 6-phosphate synthase/phosphatase